MKEHSTVLVHKKYPVNVRYHYCKGEVGFLTAEVSCGFGKKKNKQKKLSMFQNKKLQAGTEDMGIKGGSIYQSCRTQPKFNSVSKQGACVTLSVSLRNICPTTELSNYIKALYNRGC